MNLAAPLRVEFVPRSGVAALRPAWADLMARTIEPNVLMSPAFAGAALENLSDTAGFGLVAVWQDMAPVARLVGLAAMRPFSRRWILPLRAAEAMAHNYGPLGTPLLDRELAVPAGEALLTWLRQGPLRQRLLYWPYIATGGPAATALEEAMRARKLSWQATGAHQRALAGAPGTPQAPALSAKRAKSLNRMLRRLRERAPLHMRVATTPAEVEQDVGLFMALEEASWKGRIATATSQRPDRKAFMQAALTGLAQEGRVRLHVWHSGETAIAAGIALIDSPRAWFWKTAYNENLASLSPGVQLARTLTDDVLASPGVTSIDSLADADHPMIDRMWPGRLDMAHWIVDLEPNGRALWLARGLESTRSRARTLLSGLRRRLRGG